MGIGYVCHPGIDHSARAFARNKNIILETARRLAMLSPRPRPPYEQIRHSISLLEAEAKHAREEAESALARAQEAEATAVAHEETAQEWRRILGVLDDHAKNTRTVKVKLSADVEDYIADMQRAVDATRKAGESLPYAQGGIHSGTAPLANIAEPEQS